MSRSAAASMRRPTARLRSSGTGWAASITSMRSQETPCPYRVTAIPSSGALAGHACSTARAIAAAALPAAATKVRPCGGAGRRSRRALAGSAMVSTSRKSSRNIPAGSSDAANSGPICSSSRSTGITFHRSLAFRSRGSQGDRPQARRGQGCPHPIGSASAATGARSSSRSAKRNTPCRLNYCEWSHRQPRCRAMTLPRRNSSPASATSPSPRSIPRATTPCALRSMTGTIRESTRGILLERFGRNGDQMLADYEAALRSAGLRALNRFGPSV